VYACGVWSPVPPWLHSGAHGGRWCWALHTQLHSVSERWPCAANPATMPPCKSGIGVPVLCEQEVSEPFRPRLCAFQERHFTAHRLARAVRTSIDSARSTESLLPAFRLLKAVYVRSCVCPFLDVTRKISLCGRLEQAIKHFMIANLEVCCCWLLSRGLGLPAKM
jgi:hypothetical protein